MTIKTKGLDYPPGLLSLNNPLHGVFVRHDRVFSCLGLEQPPVAIDAFRPADSYRFRRPGYGQGNVEGLRSETSPKGVEAAVAHEGVQPLPGPKRFSCQASKPEGKAVETLGCIIFRYDQAVVSRCIGEEDVRAKGNNLDGQLVAGLRQPKFPEKGADSFKTHARNSCMG